MKRRTEKKYSAQLLADYAEDHAMVKNAIAEMLLKENPCFMLAFNDRQLEDLLKLLYNKIKTLKEEAAL